MGGAPTVPKENQVVVFGEPDDSPRRRKRDKLSRQERRKLREELAEDSFESEEEGDGYGGGRKQTAAFETELAGHSEKILGQIAGSDINFSRYEEVASIKPTPIVEQKQQRQYPDQSFVNLNDSFSQNAYNRQSSLHNAYQSNAYIQTQPNQEYADSMLAPPMDQNSQLQAKTLWPSQVSLSNPVKEPDMPPPALTGIPPNSYNMQTPEYLHLKQRYDELNEQYQKDKKFYDQALEVRTNQLEEKESEVERLMAEKAEVQKQLDDAQENLNQLEFEKEQAVKE